MSPRSLLTVLLTLLPAGIAPTTLAEDTPKPAKPLRAGIIGLDTSHVMAFTRILNNPQATGELAGVNVVAGYPGGTGKPPVSPDETLEIHVFMEAADESKRQGGVPVTIESVLAQARAERSVSR